MKFRSTVVAAILAVTSLAAGPLPAWSSVANEISRLNKTEQQEFEGFVSAVDNWDGSEESFNALSGKMQRFLDRHPGFVPAMVESTRLQWARSNSLFGLVNASKSFLPIYLDLQKQAPEYSKSYLFAARCYIFTQDYEGALPSLKRATELSDSDPWVHLTWAHLHERKLEPDLAAEAARKAVPFAGESADAMAFAVNTITRNHGVRDLEGVNALAKSIYAANPDRAFVSAVISKSLDTYSYESGLLQVLAELATITVAEFGPDPGLLLAWSRIALVAGNAHMAEGAARLDASFMRPAEEILFSIKDKPDVAEAVWGLRIDIALSKGELDEGQRLLGEGERAGYPAKHIGQKTVALLNAQDKPREIVELYRHLRFPDDNIVMEARARTGDRDIARMYYLRMIEENPTNAYLKGNYAGFMLYYFDNALEAADYAQQAYKLTPYPLAQYTLATAYLTLSGQELRSGNLAAGRHYYSQAVNTGFQESVILQSCYKTCEAIEAALTAFR